MMPRLASQFGISQQLHKYYTAGWKSMDTISRNTSKASFIFFFLKLSVKLLAMRASILGGLWEWIRKLQVCF